MTADMLSSLHIPWPNLDTASYNSSLGHPTLVQRPTPDLHPHPRYVQLCGSIAESTIFEMTQLGDRLFEEPLMVTDSGTILDGYKRWLVAQEQQRPTLRCIQHRLDSNAEVLSLLVELQLRRPKARNDFQRIVLALELEPLLRDKAKERQRTGGRDKGSSNLTTDAGIDVRSEIARRAQVSAGNVTKVKQILAKGCPDLLAALRCGEISIHRGHQWSRQPQSYQRRLLTDWRTDRDIKRQIGRLLKNHTRKDSSGPLTPSQLAQIFMTDLPLLDDIKVEIIRCQGQRIFVSEDLSRLVQHLTQDPHTTIRSA
jgi:hypothetical protein